MSRVFWVAVAGLTLYWCIRDTTPARPRVTLAPHVAVRDDGFVSIDGAGPRRVVELDADGGVARQVRVDLPAQSRAIGGPGGTGLVWLDGGKVATAGLRTDGALGPKRHWGKQALHLCDGIASNDARWGVGWKERDKSTWFVYGPTHGRRAAADELLEPQKIADDATWCALASAGDDIVLFWRESGDRVFMNFCGKRCGSIAPPIPPSLARATILAIGCRKDGCGFVTRTGPTVRLSWIDRRGQPKWQQVLDAGYDTAAALIGAGDRALALAYLDHDGHAVVARVDAKGALTRLGRSPGPAPAPALAWSRDRLLIAGVEDGALRTEVVALPR
jgi:hypothetical protein